MHREGIKKNQSALSSISAGVWATVTAVC